MELRSAQSCTWVGEVGADDGALKCLQSAPGTTHTPMHTLCKRRKKINPVLVQQPQRSGFLPAALRRMQLPGSCKSKSNIFTESFFPQTDGLLTLLHIEIEDIEKSVTASSGRKHRMVTGNANTQL